MTKANPFDYVTSISLTKKDLIRESDNPSQAEKDYVPYLVNKQLSYFIDSILYANEMNQFAELDNLLQFDYYMGSISKKKRFTKWAKPFKSEDLEAVMKYYSYGRKKAEEALSILTPKDIKAIHETLDLGG